MRYFIFMLLLPLTSVMGISQDTTGTVVIISEKIGPTIDLEERNFYKIFPGVQNFQSAVLLQRPDGSYIFKVSAKKAEEPSAVIRWMSITEQDLVHFRNKVKVPDMVSSAARLSQATEASQEADLLTLSIKELLAGSGVAVLLAFSGALIGNSMADPHSDDPQEPMLGISVGLTLGSAIGVKVAGSTLEDTGTFGGALVGAAICPVLGAIAGLGKHNESEWDKSVRITSCSFLSPLGAVIGYALSRHTKQGKSQSLLKIEDRKIRFAFPACIARPVLLPRNQVSWEYRFRLVNVRF